MEPGAHLAGHDEKFDRAVHLAALRLLKPEIFGLEKDFPSRDISDKVQEVYDGLNALYSENKKDVDSMVQKIANDLRVKRVLRDYWLILNLVENIDENETLAEYNLKRAAKLGLEAALLSYRDLKSLERTTRRDAVGLRESVADREALKVDFSALGVAVLVTIVSALFTISGYLYNHELFSAFGVDVSKFFTLSDYIASSISRLSNSFIAAGLVILGFFHGHYRSSRKSTAQFNYEKGKRKYLDYIIVGALAIITAIAYKLDMILFYPAGFLTIAALAMFLLPKICRKVFKKSNAAMYALIFSVCFFAEVWRSVGTTIAIFRYGDLHEMKAYDIELKDSTSFSTSDHLLIAANSGFLFFLDEERKIHILSKDHLQYFVQRQEEVGVDPFFLYPERNWSN